MATKTDVINDDEPKGKKFIGLRISRSQAEQLAAVAAAKGVSLNDLLVDTITKVNDPSPQRTAAKLVKKSIDVQTSGSDDVNQKLERFRTLLQIQGHLNKEYQDLRDSEPSMFSSKELRDWRHDVKLLEDRYAKIGEQIDALYDELFGDSSADSVDSDPDASTAPDADPAANSDADPDTGKQDKGKSVIGKLVNYLNSPVDL